MNINQYLEWSHNYHLVNQALPNITIMLSIESVVIYEVNY